MYLCKLTESIKNGRPLRLGHPFCFINRPHHALHSVRPCPARAPVTEVDTEKVKVKVTISHKVHCRDGTFDLLKTISMTLSCYI